MKTVLCMKWGTLYPADYVNRLHSMVTRQTTPPLRFVCLTDDPAGLNPEIIAHECPTVPIKDHRRNTGWRKLALWQPELFDLTGDALFLDLDVVVVDSLDPLFEHPGDFCVMRNWTQPKLRIGNTSVFRFTIGKHPYIWERFVEDPEKILREHDNEQMYISETISSLTFFPDEWCLLFKVHCVPPMPARWFVEPKLPSGARVVAFPGVPNPPEAAEGRWPAKWQKRFYKHIRPASWVREHWR